MVKFGVEIECIRDRGKEINRYATLKDDFSAKADGSLRVMRENQIKFSEPYTTEIITKIFTDKKDFLKAIDKFIKRFSNNGKYELNEVLDFNKTCGCHIHISLEQKNRGYFLKNSHFKLLKDVREYYFNRVKHSKTKSKDDILAHYYRTYAKKVTTRNMLDGERYKEFNFCSDLDGKGLEMRGTNILNVKTWNEFKEQMIILFETAEYLEKTFKKKFQFQKTIKFNEDDYNKMVRDREPMIIQDDRERDDEYFRVNNDGSLREETEQEILEIIEQARY